MVVPGCRLRTSHVRSTPEITRESRLRIAERVAASLLVRRRRRGASCSAILGSHRAGRSDCCPLRAVSDLDRRNAIRQQPCWWDPGTLTRSLNCSGNDRKYIKPMASEIVVYTVIDEREIGIRKVDGDVVFKRLFAAH
jgi:hypothetical protein